MWNAPQNRVIQVLQITSRFIFSRISSMFIIKRQSGHLIMPDRSPQPARLATPACRRPALHHWSKCRRGSWRHLCIWAHLKWLNSYPCSALMPWSRCQQSNCSEAGITNHLQGFVLLVRHVTQILGDDWWCLLRSSYCAERAIRAQIVKAPIFSI